MTRRGPAGRDEVPSPPSAGVEGPRAGSDSVGYRRPRADSSAATSPADPSGRATRLRLYALADLLLRGDAGEADPLDSLLVPEEYAALAKEAICMFAALLERERGTAGAINAVQILRSQAENEGE